ncbi:Mannose-6-phosphate isomerase, class I [Clostridium amylolyticum]|uniref:Mannose-6-phosphate isomerase, class I n=1 Tax=Clostridium amylolyticum TaxID=1121298 RepID=A0A1M6BLT6_9CLOT|nr:class I mannose-6-phosphate isomerase [Clostridium amylolyticum]SHI49780.1 Mannose-6-phosphate isomerase, class I [Clostridium amylolyticum]
MSFMFKPLAYDDLSAINKPLLSSFVRSAIVVGNENVAEKIIGSLGQFQKPVVLVDGYVGSNFVNFVEQLQKQISGKSSKGFDMKDVYLSEEKINELTKSNLPLNYDDDPVLLFGSLFDGKLEDFIDYEKLKTMVRAIMDFDGVSIVYGHGATLEPLLEIAAKVVYIDISPKSSAIRAREGKFKNIGDNETRPFNALMRRNYFVDFEIVIHQRKKLIDKNFIDFYIDGNWDDEYKLLPFGALKELLGTLVKYPFRSKPVYLEGIWGGEYIRKVRNIPMDISKNIAWIFEFIPMETSIVVDVNSYKFELPFATFMTFEGKSILGEKAYESFGGYFPIRFNYDDTYHSDGNMSIQVHPKGEFTRKHYNEKGSQDEAYYVIATGHNAKTYVGFRNDANVDEFIELAEKSQSDGSDVNYKKYINGEASIPGKQFMLPAGTIHASGQNQFILELGSLTIGSYTYKIYDYNRKDKDGKPRPIHMKNAKKVLEYNRNADWVRKNIMIEPILTKECEDFKEYIVGDTNLMYYQTSRVELNTRGIYSSNNNDQFTVITLVDGEEIEVYSKSNPDFKFTQKYLEIVVIPANITDYVIVNKGYQPAVVHKTYLKPNFENYIL